MTGPVVSRRWLERHREAVILVDVRRGRDELPAAVAYEQGHLPGAVLVDLDRWLAGPPSAQAGRHPLPPPEQFAEGMELAGISSDDTVVAYDDADGVVAARLVWMLRATGHDAALLDGGPRPGEGPLERRPTTRPRGSFVVRPWPVAQLADVGAATDRRNVVLDARPGSRYAGAPDPLDPRPGHIPGARSLPCRDNLDERGRLLPDDVLRQRFAAVGVVDGSCVVSTCGSGVTACHTLLLIEHLGLGSGRLYPGSWSQYASSPERPVELGPGDEAGGA